jgi:HlyD family secretion protein
MKIRLFAFLFFASFIFSCSGRKNYTVITYSLSKSDFLEKVYVPGTVQAVVNTPVMPPRNQLGMMTVKWIVADGSLVRKGDTLCILSAPEVESKYKEMLISIETLEAELKKAEADNQLNIALLEAQLKTSEAQFKISSLDSLKMKFAPDTQKRLLDLEIKRTLIEKQKTEKKLAATKIIGETDLRQKRAMIAQERMKAQSYYDQLSSMTITAQRDGLVMRAEMPRFMVSSGTGVGSFGGPVREGTVILLSTPILQFPDLSRMQISASVAEADFKKIERGQKVFVTVDAVEKLVTTGKVNRKNLASSTAMRYNESKVRSYEVIIDLDSCHSKMKPGLSADCEVIITEEKDTLFVPTMAIFEKDSLKIVYVKNAKEFLPVNIETGTSGSSFTIISGGLKGGERIALTEPPQRLITRKEDTNNHQDNHNRK